MSRTTSASLTAKIVRAARRLWHERGEKGLTLRAVARAAGTTTPSVYQRFPSKDRLVGAIADQVRLELGAEIAGSRNLAESCRRYLRFADGHRHEYGLFFGPAFGPVFSSAGQRPGFEWGRKQLARTHGGAPEDYESDVWAVTCLLHGGASLLRYLPPGEFAEKIRSSCLMGCQVLTANPLGGKKKRRKKRRP